MKYQYFLTFCKWIDLFQIRALTIHHFSIKLYLIYSLNLCVLKVSDIVLVQDEVSAYKEEHKLLFPRFNYVCCIVKGFKMQEFRTLQPIVILPLNFELISKSYQSRQIRLRVWNKELIFKEISSDILIKLNGVNFSFFNYYLWERLLIK